VGGSSGGGAAAAAAANGSGPGDGGARKGLRPSISDSNLQAIAYVASAAAAGQVSGSGSYSLGRPPVARHRRAHSSSSTGAIAGGDTIVSGAVLNAAVAADSPLHTAGYSSSMGGYAGGGSGGGMDSSGGGMGLAPAAASAASVVNKAAIISFKKVEVLVGTLDLNTDQVCTMHSMAGGVLGAALFTRWCLCYMISNHMPLMSLCKLLYRLHRDSKHQSNSPAPPLLPLPPTGLPGGGVPLHAQVL
jgi:hypothetical protein